MTSVITQPSHLTNYHEIITPIKWVSDQHTREEGELLKFLLRKWHCLHFRLIKPEELFQKEITNPRTSRCATLFQIRQ